MLQIVLGFVAGLIVGWVLEWALDWRFWRVRLPSRTPRDFGRGREKTVNQHPVPTRATDKLTSQTGTTEDE